jgi:hypothetical protein
MSVKADFGYCARKCARQFPRHVLQISGADDVVAVEHIAGSMSCHRYALRNTLIDHVPHRGAPKIMAQHAGTTRFQTCSLPGSLKILDTLAFVPASYVREEKRNDTGSVAIFHLRPFEV